MKVKPGFMLQTIAGNPVIVPLDDQLKRYNGLFKINEEAAFLFEKMQAGAEDEAIVCAFAAHFGGTREEGRDIYEDFAASLRRFGILEEA